MRMPQFNSSTVPGWPPIVTGSTLFGVWGHVSPWNSAVFAMPSLTQVASELFVGAEEAIAARPDVVPTGGPNTSTTGESIAGAPVPYHINVAGIATQPIGSVIV